MTSGILKSPAAIAFVVVSATGAIALSLLRPPAFWLFGLGVAMIVAMAIVNGRRTGIWFHTPWERSDREFLPPFESALGTGGVLLMIIPLAVAVFKILVGR